MATLPPTKARSRYSHPRGALALLAIAGGACGAPGGAPAEGIAGPIDPSRLATLPGNLVPALRAAEDLGRLDGAIELPAISLELRPSPGQRSERAALLARQQDRSSPDYHRWLTPEEYGARFGAARPDLDRIGAWLASEGFTAPRVARSATAITVAGTVAQVEAAFHTELHRYRLDGHPRFGLARDPALPEALSGLIGGLRGLDDVPLRPLYTLGGQHHVAPGDFATIYHAGALYAAGIDGAGAKIGIVGATFYTPGDISTFRTLTGLAPIDLQDVFVPGTGSAAFVDPNAIGEAELDIELASAVARGAQIVYVHTGGAAGTGIRDALQHAIDNQVADIVSVSWGGCEKTFSAAGVTALQDLGDQANAQGMTLVAASGDSGAAGCDHWGSAVATKGPAVLLPSTLPQVTAVGGTMFDEGAGNPWSATNGPNLGSATAYIPEKAWNDTAALGGLWAGGGGVSTLFPKPAWQVGAGVPADGKRDVPDVSLDASGNHDAMVVYYTPPAGTNGSGFYFVAGTSAAAPSFAGILALVEQATGSGPLGNVNPMLYALAAHVPAAFHDVTSGDNIVPCKAGTTGCPAAPPYQYGHSAGPGYDLATGLGSVDALAFVNGWVSCAASACGAGGSGGGGSTSSGAGGAASGSTTSSGAGGAASSSTTSSGAGGAASSSTTSGSTSSSGAGGATSGSTTSGGAGGSTSSTTTTSGGAMTSSGTTSTGAGSGGAAGPGGHGGASASGSGGGSPDEPGGCAMASRPGEGAAPPGVVALGLVALAWSRRRRRAPRSASA
jgi:MYXO-CTERM domain-containing protein